jgi:cytochrome c553
VNAARIDLPRRPVRHAREPVPARAAVRAHPLDPLARVVALGMLVMPGFMSMLAMLVMLTMLAMLVMLSTPASAAEPDAAALEFFEKQVRPLLVTHCYECHADGESSGGLALDTRAGLIAGGDSGPAVVPGKPDESRIVEAVRYANPDLQMPPHNRLSAADVAVFERWVAAGAVDPREEAAAPAAAAPLGMSLEEGRTFWSMRPISRPEVPTVRHADRVRTPIDAFVLAALERAGLEPAPPADKRTLLRRVTFDLTGLPPTPAEVAAFLADDTPDAFDRVVERLLSSPDYGVRWGRHWLDVARYADSNGLDENLAFGQAWRYRDYVVNSFNHDKPFDRFLAEQIAGDLLPDAGPETITATGYLVLGAKVLAEPDREKLEMDTIDEQLDALGKGFLGMTLGCVRCHDHKFDPLTQADYYALAAIFKSTRTFADTNTGAIKHWHEHGLATDEEREAMKQIDEQIAALKKAASSFRSDAMAKIRTDARGKAADYLVACATFGPDAPLTEVAAVGAPLGLHPYILHHCRLHLAYHPDDAVFGRWHELAAAGDRDGIDRHYRTLFAEAEAAWQAARQADPKAASLADARLEAARAALDDAAGFLAVPPKPEFAFDAATLAEYHRLQEAGRIAESGAPDLPAAMAVGEATVLAEMPIHVRGNHRNHGRTVSRGFPQVMLAAHAVDGGLPAERSGRLELARWLAHPEHPLTSRVFVNRVWRWHFGRGIVGTTDNFGVLGDRPTHPELLDWLARRFTDSGWSIKDLHRLILASDVYRMASTHPHEVAAAAIDPENRLLWRFPVRRLEAEEIRDALLATTDRLERGLGGKTVPLRNRQFVFDHTSIDHTRYDSLRRAIYLPVIRNNLYTLFEQFDFPDPTMPTGSRAATVVAPQALFMLNAPLVMDSAAAWARALAARTDGDADRLRSAYEAAYSRPPTDAETQRALAFLAAAPGDSERAWALLCQGILAANEFIYLR